MPSDKLQKFRKIRKNQIVQISICTIIRYYQLLKHYTTNIPMCIGKGKAEQVNYLFFFF